MIHHFCRGSEHIVKKLVVPRFPNAPKRPYMITTRTFLIFGQSSQLAAKPMNSLIELKIREGMLYHLKIQNITLLAQGKLRSICSLESTPVGQRWTEVDEIKTSRQSKAMAVRIRSKQALKMKQETFRGIKFDQIVGLSTLRVCWSR